MGFFSKIFGKNDSNGISTDDHQSDDFTAALSMHLRGEIEPALTSYLKIAENDPEDFLAPFFSSAIKAGAGNVDEAAENLRSLSQRISLTGDGITKVISVNLASLVSNDSFISVPAVAEIVVTFGDVLKKSGFVQESAVCFEIAAGLVPSNAHVLHKLGDTLHDLRHYDYAESVLLEALKLAPNHWGSLYTYAVLLQDVGRFADAIAYYEQAVRLDPNHVRCQNNYGVSLLQVNRLEEALEHCTLAAGLAPDFPLAKINLGNINLMMQQYEAARTWYEEAIALDKNLAPAYFGLASAEQRLGGDTGRIRDLYLKTIELNPSLPDAHHALGNLLAGEGDHEALAHYLAAAHLNKSLMNLHTDFGRACLQMGRREEGLEHLKTALQQNPDDATAKKFLSEYAEKA